MENHNNDNTNVKEEKVDVNTNNINIKEEKVDVNTNNINVKEKKVENDSIKSLKSTNLSYKDIQLVIFKIENEEFGININKVLEISKFQEITRVPNIEDYIEGVMNLRGRIHIVINLSKKLGFKIKKIDDDTRIIIVEINDNKIGILVDSVSEVLKASSNHLKPAPEYLNNKLNSDYISEVAIFDQRLIILPDLAKLLGINNIKEILDSHKNIQNN